jgi:hypothetical protein
MAIVPTSRSRGAALRPPWARNSFLDDVQRLRRQWAKVGPLSVRMQNFPRWRTALVDRYAGLQLRGAYVPLTAGWMRRYLSHAEVWPVLRLLAGQGVDVGQACSLIGFCAEHHVYFTHQGTAFREVFAKVLTLKRRPSLSAELEWCATQLRALADAGAVGFVNGWVKLGRRLPKGQRGESVEFAQAVPLLLRLAKFLGHEAIGWANLADARYLLSGKRGALPAPALDACAAELIRLLRRAGFAATAIHAHLAQLLGPAFFHTSPKALSMRLTRQIKQPKELPVSPHA